ncbi:DUF4446 family protein [Paenibacillus woosongensis]|uniref:DUF4446 family protein n=1 Tax=Paenibacillus woosongensis TaxID=307580 RepID=A0AA95I573_9BACL|nr:DUF4446 family protein [Paenibacillus woosongensis]WHX49126.1 DUF4446 family protein [Paenibacillus woosongensis]
MQEWNELILEQLVWVVIGLVIVVVWLLIWNLLQGSKLRKIRRKYELMMQGTGVEDLEGLLIDLKLQQGKLEDAQEHQQQILKQLQSLLPKQKAKIGIKRYNAFAERGNDLSFSIAFINDEKDGVVLTGIYNREGSYVYAKPLTKGESSHALSTEELEVIALAAQGE